MDLFKPLYKAHRRIAIDDLNDVFDPHSLKNVHIGDYELIKSESESDCRGVSWACSQLPGLRIISGSLTISQQQRLVEESLVHFLESKEHLTNLDAHHKIARPIIMFEGLNDHSASQIYSPTGKQSTPVRNKIRWVTLGGQYNWTEKVYPSFEPGTPGCPLFPKSLAGDIASELGMRPEAAIVNYYSEGDILSPHQDVAELTRKDLVSISLGCACIFYVGAQRYEKAPLSILLRSGDIVIMGSDSRFAFHGVGRVFADTSPVELQGGTDLLSGNEYHQYIANHRININVRQMCD